MSTEIRQKGTFTNSALCFMSHRANVMLLSASCLVASHILSSCPVVLFCLSVLYTHLLFSTISHNLSSKIFLFTGFFSSGLNGYTARHCPFMVFSRTARFSLQPLAFGKWKLKNACRELRVGTEDSTCIYIHIWRREKKNDHPSCLVLAPPFRQCALKHTLSQVGDITLSCKQRAKLLFSGDVSCLVLFFFLGWHIKIWKWVEYETF